MSLQMLAAEIESISNLEIELIKAKDSLKKFENDLKRLIGRDSSNSNKHSKKSSQAKSESKKRPAAQPIDPPPVKRKESVFDRLDKPNEEPSKVQIHSRVIVQPREIPSRQDALNAQSKDIKAKERNKRMFSALMGTLQKFRQEETKLKPKEEKRAKVEKKLEYQEILERERMKRERAQLFLNRKRKQEEIKILEQKMILIQEYNDWLKNYKPLLNFIETKKKPHIYYLPKKLNEKAEKSLKESKHRIEKTINEKKEQLDNTIKELEDKLSIDYQEIENQNLNINYGKKEADGVELYYNKRDRKISENGNGTDNENDFSNVVVKIEKIDDEKSINNGVTNNSNNHALKKEKSCERGEKNVKATEKNPSNNLDSISNEKLDKTPPNEKLEKLDDELSVGKIIEDKEKGNSEELKHSSNRDSTKQNIENDISKENRVKNAENLPEEDNLRENLKNSSNSKQNFSITIENSRLYNEKNKHSEFQENT